MAKLYKRPESEVWWMDYRDADGKRHRRTTLTTDRKEANIVMARAVAGVKAQGRNRKRGSDVTYGPTLADAYKRAMRDHPKWRDSNDHKTINKNRKAVEAYFGEDRKLASIGREDVAKFIESMAGLAGSTVNQRVSYVSVLFDLAIDKWEFHELVKPRIVRQKVAEGRTRRFSPEEEAEAIERLEASTKLHHPDVADLVRVLIDTGLRLNEGIRITKRDYDLDKRAVIIWNTKNGQPRAVPMTPRVHEVLTKRQYLDAPFEMLTDNIASKAWAWVRAEMGFEEDAEFVIHVLRHTVGSRLADAGTSGPLIQAMLGHKSFMTTQKYIHVSAAGLQQAADVLAKASSKGVAKSVSKGAQNGPKSMPKESPKSLISHKNNWRTQDSKSPAARRAGSIPALGTNT